MHQGKDDLIRVPGREQSSSLQKKEYIKLSDKENEIMPENIWTNVKKDYMKIMEYLTIKD